MVMLVLVLVVGVGVVVVVVRSRESRVSRAGRLLRRRARPHVVHVETE
jgi:hypothetical protein